MFLQCDLHQSVDDPPRAIFSQMKITCEQDVFAHADVRNGFTAYQQWPSPADFDGLEEFSQKFH